MRKRNKIICVVLSALALFLIGTYTFANIWGRGYVVSQLKAFSGKEVSIGDFCVSPPLRIVIKKIDIRGLGTIDYLSVSPSIVGLLSGKIAFNEIRIVRPVLNIDTGAKKQSPESVAGQNKAPDPSVNLVAAMPDKSAKEPPVSDTVFDQGQLPNIIIKRIILRQGRVNLADRNVSQEGIKITFKDVELSLTNLYTVPRPVITRFMLKGKIPWQEGQEDGSIDLEGWIDLFKKDMQASLKIADIDGIYLYPYYSTWVDLEKARIEKAKLNFISNLSGLNNNLAAECRLELTDIVRRPRESSEPQEKAERLTDAVLDIFRAMNQGKIVLNFTIHTKMDRPEFGFGDIKMAFENKLAQARRGSFGVDTVLKLPVNILQGAFKSAGELTRAVFEGIVTIGKEAKKAADGALDRSK